MPKLIVILGSTALGKTELAVNLAFRNKGEIISADSRQVYKNMDIGTGKDLDEYRVKEVDIPYHLIDILDAGSEYNLFQFQEDYHAVLKQIYNRGNLPILCGGTGLYLQTALQKEKLIAVPQNSQLRRSLEELSQRELVEFLKDLKKDLHNQTDTEDKERTIRAIEIASYQKDKPNPDLHELPQSFIFGIKAERPILRERIKIRLDSRLNHGMIEEVQGLLDRGISYEKLAYYGLEYKFIAQYIMKKIDYDQMYDILLQGIRRFAKKQETWFRRMEKQGFNIHWLDLNLSLEEKMDRIEERLNG